MDNEKREKLQKRIAELEKKISAAKSKLNTEERKERNRQLIALGVFMELCYKREAQQGREKLALIAEKSLANNPLLAHIKKAFERLEKEIIHKRR